MNVSAFTQKNQYCKNFQCWFTNSHFLYKIIFQALTDEGLDPETYLFDVSLEKQRPSIRKI